MQQGIPEGEVRFYLQQLVLTLRYVHAKHVVHRDIKLDNILLQPEPGLPANRPRIKVADFGLSRIGDVGVTNVGTRMYKAPEVLPEYAQQGENPEPYNGPKADVYSAGITLYILLARRYVFGYIPAGATDWEWRRLMQQQHIWDGIQQLAVSDGCKQLLRQMTHFDPDQRLSIEQVMGHPWFQQDLPPQLVQETEQAINANTQSPCADVVTPLQLEAIRDNALQLLQGIIQ